MSQVAENKAVEYTAGEKVQLTRRPRELEVLSLLREHAEVYGMSRQVDEFVQSYEQLFTKSKEYQAHVL
ncbi:MAG: hypothetical protein H6767_01975 [Candidatus Peribacteria bacterium]|nr:MAG: hypothetical protein H6767_01975 [Candidatus Peribacteria bacterium]